MSKLPKIQWQIDLADLLFRDDSEKALEEPERYYIGDTDVRFKELIDMVTKNIISAHDRGYKSGKMDK